MKFALVVFACVLAVASAQFNRENPYNPFGYYQKEQYNRNPYNYNRNQYNYNRDPYNRYSTPAPYRPYYSTFTPTPAPVAVPVTSTVAPAVVPIANVYSDARAAGIVKYGNEINADGSYSYFYETDNGIAAQEQGTPRDFGGNPPVVPDVAQGSFSWTSPEGKSFVFSYVADENGYQPSGEAIPTPHPIPEAILRSLEYNAKHAPVQKK